MGEDTKKLTEIPFGFQGKVYRSPMPFSPYDISEQTWHLYSEANIEVVLVLAESHEMFAYADRNLLDFYRSQGLSTIHYPIEDYQIPKDCKQFSKIIDQVITQAKLGRNVVVHCLAGIGRTGLVLAAIAKKHLGLDGDGAIRWIRDYIPGAAENIAQEQFIHDYSG